MDWGDCSEPQDIFEEEVADRFARLVEGAQAIIDGTFRLDPSHDLAREVHTNRARRRAAEEQQAVNGHGCLTSVEF